MKPAMITFEFDDSLTAVQDLRELIGPKHRSWLTADHPLFAGFAAADQFLRDVLPSPKDLIDLSELQWFAESVLEHLAGEKDDYKLRRNLRNKEACRALWFEAFILRRVVEPRVDVARWRRYEEGTDILCRKPALQVECRLVIDPTPLKLIRALREKAGKRQSREGEGPFVIALGADRLLTSEEVDATYADFTGRQLSFIEKWVARHPEVAGVVVTLPRLHVPGWRDLNGEAGLLDYGRAFSFWIRNRHAAIPMPDGIELDTSRAQVATAAWEAVASFS